MLTKLELTPEEAIKVNMAILKHSEGSNMQTTLHQDRMKFLEAERNTIILEVVGKRGLTLIPGDMKLEPFGKYPCYLTFTAPEEKKERVVPVKEATDGNGNGDSKIVPIPRGAVKNRLPEEQPTE